MVKGFNFLIIVLLPLSCSCLVHRYVCASPLPRPAIFHRHNSTPFAVVAPRFPNLNPSNFHSRLIFILLIPLTFDWPRYLHQATLISSPCSITFSAFSSTLTVLGISFHPPCLLPFFMEQAFPLAFEQRVQLDKCDHRATNPIQEEQNHSKILRR